jgi:hypothetical protein
MAWFTVPPSYIKEVRVVLDSPSLDKEGGRGWLKKSFGIMDRGHPVRIMASRLLACLSRYRAVIAFASFSIGSY